MALLKTPSDSHEWRLAHFSTAFWFQENKNVRPGQPWGARRVEMPRHIKSLIDQSTILIDLEEPLDITPDESCAWEESFPTTCPPSKIKCLTSPRRRLECLCQVRQMCPCLVTEDYKAASPRHKKSISKLCKANHNAKHRPRQP